MDPSTPSNCSATSENEESTPDEPAYRHKRSKRRLLFHHLSKRSQRREVTRVLFADAQPSNQFCPKLSNFTPHDDNSEDFSTDDSCSLEESSNLHRITGNASNIESSSAEDFIAPNIAPDSSNPDTHPQCLSDVQAEPLLTPENKATSGSDINSMEFSDLMTFLADCPEDFEIDIFDLLELSDDQYFSYFAEEDFDLDSFFTNDVSCASMNSQSELERVLSQFKDEDETDRNNYDEAFLADRVLHKEVGSTLKEWALDEQIEQSKIDRLLKKLKLIPELSKLPSTARGLISTRRPASEPVDVPSGGQYLHFGAEKCLSRILRGRKGRHVELHISTDGVNLFKSKSCELWPILARIRNIKSLSHIVFPIGFFYNDHKPKKPDYLKHAVDELERLIKDGLEVDGEHFTISVKGCICDAPAKAMALGIMHCTGKNSCTRCKVKGTWSEQSKRVFFGNDAEPRSHQEFINQTDESFHHFRTPLERITTLQFPQSYSLDYLHLILLGVCRTTVYLWLLGKRPHRMPPAGRGELIEHSKQLARFAPREFSRRPRSYEEVSFFKGTEWRQMLCYHGMVIFNYNRIPIEKYKHFLCLVVAVRLLLDEKMMLEAHWLSYARNLLRYFVDKFRVLYDADFITHNFHNLLHISDDVEFFGGIEDCSAFKFESFIQFLLKLITKGSGVLQQIARRLEELYKNDLLFKQKAWPYFVEPDVSKPSFGGPLTDGVCDPQFQSLKYKFFELSLRDGDNCCTVKEEAPAGDGSVIARNRVIIIENICKSRSANKMMLVGRRFIFQESYFDYPLDSSLLGIYKVSSLSSILNAWPVENLSWNVVLFEDGRCGIAPTNWLTPKRDRCAYPKVNSFALNKLIQAATEVKDDWPSYLVRKFYAENLLTFKEARAALDSVDSDVSEIENMNPSPQPVLPQTALPQPVLPQPVLPQPVLPQPVLPQPVLPQPVLPQPVQPQPVLPEPVQPQPVLPQPVQPQPVLPQPAQPAQSQPVENFNTDGEAVTVSSQCLRQLFKVTLQNQAQLKALNESRSQSQTDSTINSATPVEEAVPILSACPLKSTKDFKKLEKALGEDSKVRKQLREELQLHMKKNPKESCRNLARCLIADELAQKFSWKGRPMKNQPNPKGAFEVRSEKAARAARLSVSQLDLSSESESEET
ncbi:unnamed protein product [Bemisia tabaci]|uniref:DUF4806 domain-containing protein n=1 Tax=Bemisia tabaci TaxID=7038 RepID=A0A9P0AAN9_BEMTA|nr:unnamed protein product [Bemisia tabaci]